MLKEKIALTLEELKKMIKNKEGKEKIEEKRKQLDKLLKEYIKEI